MSIESTINDFYNMRLVTTQDFENALLDFSKEELVGFIIEQQSRGMFKSLQTED